jgi:hypothetical protein
MSTSELLLSRLSRITPTQFQHIRSICWGT